ncbi:MAG: glycosyltransferase [Candidatus Nanohalobium sp.]
MEEGCNIAEGRNIAVEEASNEYIVSTDGGCVLDEKWYEEMCKAFDESDYVIGMFQYRAENLFEKVREMGEQGLENVKKYSWSNFSDKLVRCSSRWYL